MRLLGCWLKGLLGEENSTLFGGKDTVAMMTLGNLTVTLPTLKRSFGNLWPGEPRVDFVMFMYVWMDATFVWFVDVMVACALSLRRYGYSTCNPVMGQARLGCSTNA